MLIVNPHPSNAVSWNRLRLACLVAIAVCCSAGCKTPLNTGIDGIYGPAGREAQAALEEKSRAAGGLNPIEGAAELEQARALYEAKQYEEARKEFKKIKKKYKDKPIEEDAMFMMAECDFEMKKYPAAQDGYDELFKKHNSTRYTDQMTKRMFKIAQTWLNFPKPASDLELAQYSTPDVNRGQTIGEAVTYTFPLTPNLFDRSRPVFDTQGRAIQALTTIWLHDSTGPLADDALMMAATYHLRKRDFQEADRYFKLVRENYPQSEYVQASYVIGAHAKLMTYQGSRYDGQTLKDASDLTQSTIRMFPDLPQRDNLLEKLSNIRQQKAERDWERVQYHMRRKEKTAAVLYCKMILEAHPQSPFAEKAHQLIAKIDPKQLEPFLRPVPEEPLPGTDDQEEGYPGREVLPESEAGGEGGRGDEAGDPADSGTADAGAEAMDGGAAGQEANGQEANGEDANGEEAAGAESADVDAAAEGAASDESDGRTIRRSAAGRTPVANAPQAAAEGEEPQ